MYCSEKYYNFIGDVIESTHVANLTLDMMMAYADGDIICEIKERILKSDAVKSKFAALCSTTDEATFSTEDTEKLLAYILDRYANMRGAYFVKHMRGCQNSSAGKLAESQATRTKVLQSSAAALFRPFNQFGTIFHQRSSHSIQRSPTVSSPNTPVHFCLNGNFLLRVRGDPTDGMSASIGLEEN